MPDFKDLAAGWVSHFYAMDSLLKFTSIEEEKYMWIDDSTLLVGRIDAQGLDYETPFFADWKTLSAKMVRRVGEVKAEYEFSPQMLTYQVLCPGAERYLVRWACKTDVPVYHHQWYDCSNAHRSWWLNLIRNCASHIHNDLAFIEAPPWITRLTSCRSKYGPAYNCPFLPGCSNADWAYRPPDMEARGSHLLLEKSLQGLAAAGFKERVEFLGKKVVPGDVLVLDSTRITTWMMCDERYRREYHDGPGGTGWKSPAEPEKDKGTDMHDVLAKYYKDRMEADHDSTV